MYSIRNLEGKHRNQGKRNLKIRILKIGKEYILRAFFLFLVLRTSSRTLNNHSSFQEAIKMNRLKFNLQ